MSTLAAHPDIRRTASLLRAAVVALEGALATAGEFPIRRAELETIYDDMATAVRVLERIRD